MHTTMNRRPNSSSERTHPPAIWAGSSPLTSAGPLIGHRATAGGTIMSTIAAAAAQGTQRHRGDGNRPVGNNRSVRVAARASPGTNVHDAIHTIKGPPGSDPGLVTRSYLPYCVSKESKPWERPTVRKSQPIGLPGRREAIKPPTAENETPSTTPTAE